MTSNNEAKQSAENQDSSDSQCESPTEITKQTFRKRVWEHLEKNELATFPLPVHGRIPNFKGCEEAAARLIELEEFKGATNVEVNPDKAQEAARLVVLEQKKNLYVPVPRLKGGFLKHVTVTDETTKQDMKSSINRHGLEHHGTAVSITDPTLPIPHMDLVVVGSVAVSRSGGHRIGKGRGYADLEYGILREVGAVSGATVVVTVVHDSQVFEELPGELFGAHDIPVDYILTPSEVIRVGGGGGRTEQRAEQPKGVYWDKLSSRRVNLMPVLQTLKEMREKEGNELTLKSEDTDVESFEQNRFRRVRRFHRRRPKPSPSNEEAGGVNTEDKENGRTAPPRRRMRRFVRRPRGAPVPPNGDRPTDNSSGERTGTKTKSLANGTPTSPPATDRRRPFRRPYRRQHIDFSLKVSNIERSVRVRDLKNALTERGIRPNDITWAGNRGFCLLHYAKPRAAKTKPAPLTDTNANTVTSDDGTATTEKLTLTTADLQTVTAALNAVVLTDSDDKLSGDVTAAPLVKQPLILDNVIEILQSLKIGSADSETSLNVKIMKPATRVETTDVSAV